MMLSKRFSTESLPGPTAGVFPGGRGASLSLLSGSVLCCPLELVIRPLDKLGSHVVGPVCVLGGFCLGKWVLAD